MQLAPQNSTIRDKEQWGKEMPSRQERACVFLKARGAYVRIEIERKKSLFQQNHYNPHWQGSLPCCGERKEHIQELEEVQCGRNPRQKSQHGWSKTRKRSRRQIMKCSMYCAEEFEFYY